MDVKTYIKQEDRELADVIYEAVFGNSPQEQMAMLEQELQAEKAKELTEITKALAAKAKALAEKEMQATIIRIYEQTSFSAVEIAQLVGREVEEVQAVIKEHQSKSK